ncbi:hypothetical protein MBM_05087 [Drepanopeziza brunnea f. sp. 'multigermtubi' MB_m1]|uniref:Uncharacterized protein n=1 Tax=Marssonina brunnea f. sp. multigermtubi (strain MB_m1) TaxID=1072389 RepID=K1X7L0_MARBU|nr:uncharacterized protein MBM_05087 [Drepanopeziza brunnea f. sp. 'multigermtubi' MB_m1]EKD16618.1 hypothetical protein MBM_05087 [Drepanopeziza brunnea f. sp. 'multigermtubi' MB_m1]
MLFRNNAGLLPSFPFKLPAHTINPISTPGAQAISFLSMSNDGGIDNGDAKPQSASASIVAQALEFARDSPEGAQDPTVVTVLGTALTEIWRKIEAQPASYVMTRDEFAVFNYFQDLFIGDQLAIAAKRRYWDHLQQLSNGA